MARHGLLRGAIEADVKVRGLVRPSRKLTHGALRHALWLLRVASRHGVLLCDLLGDWRKGTQRFNLALDTRGLRVDLQPYREAFIGSRDMDLSQPGDCGTFQRSFLVSR